MIPDIGIIIPTINESQHIGRLITRLISLEPHIINSITVIDGGSTDGTDTIVKELKVNLIKSEKKNRAAQMNLGVTTTNADILYFVHADTLPPMNYLELIQQSIHSGHHAGCFPFKFRSKKPWLKINNWFSSLPFLWCRGGDQSLFVTREVWKAFGPFPEIQIMEEYHLIKKILGSKFAFDIMEAKIEVSDRKYYDNNYLWVQYVNFKAYRMFQKGVHPEKIRTYYEKSLYRGSKYGA